MRADRLLRLALLLQARGRCTASELAAELEVSVRTVYRDVEALSAAGIPVFAEPGPGGGCQLVEGYRTPFTGLAQDEARALLILGVPAPLRDLGLDVAAAAGQRRIGAAGGALSTVAVHLDMPRWFQPREETSQLPVLAESVEARRRVRVAYQSATGRKAYHDLAPLGLVNKAGIWYVVGDTPTRRTVLRVGRIDDITPTKVRFARPPNFDLAGYWDEWSAEFEATRPHVTVVVRVAPTAWPAMRQVFGEGAPTEADGRAVQDGWCEIDLRFEHDAAAAHRLVGFGGDIEVVAPPQVRELVVRLAREHDAERLFGQTGSARTCKQRSIAPSWGCAR